MKTQKIKRYRLGVSKTFPATHPRKGEQTWFVEKIIEVMIPISHNAIMGKKIHTIRSNYPLWAKRMEEVQAGRAVIELFYWADKPYRSKQVVFATLDKDSGCGVQELVIGYDAKITSYGKFMWKGIEFNERSIVYEINYIAENDGLSLEDFKAWFKGYDLSKKMAIIHFTKFRY